MACVVLSGTQIVRTLDGMEAQLLDLSLREARFAHVGILRPGSRRLVHLPAALGGLRLSAQNLWCTIHGAEWRSHGERHLRCHSGLRFTTLTTPQHTVLAGILQQLSTGAPPRRERPPWATALAHDRPPP
jgi:hypothetical protein